MGVPAENDTLRCTVVERFPVSVIQVEGALWLRTAPTVRRVLLKAVAEQPEAVVVDLTETQCVDDLGLTVFSSAVRNAAAWPAVPIVLCAAGKKTTDAIARVGVNRYVPVFRTRHDALVNVRQVDTDKRNSAVELLAEPASAGVARRAVDRACRDWDLPHLTESARTIVGELAANAIVHARSPIRVRFAVRDPYLHLAVYDGSTRPARLTAEADPQREEGRGLILVDALATAWGTLETVEGKVVWATLRIRRVGSRPGRSTHS